MFIPENPSSYGKVLEKQLPYAFPIKVVVLKKAVTKTHMAINIQFTSGMYTCPINFGEVWMTFTVGKQPSASDCSMIENVADIIAWLAMMAANVAATNIGQKTGSIIPKHTILQDGIDRPKRVFIREMRII